MRKKTEVFFITILMILIAVVASLTLTSCTGGQNESDDTGSSQNPETSLTTEAGTTVSTSDTMEATSAETADTVTDHAETSAEIIASEETVTDEVTTEPEETTSEPEYSIPDRESITRMNRQFMYRIWNFTDTPMETFRKTVDAALSDGFNSILVHITWTLTEKEPGVYDFSAYDRMLDYVINDNGAGAMISVDFCRALSTMGNDGVLGSDEVQLSMSGSTGTGAAFYERVMPSFASESAMKKMSDFMNALAEHFAQRYGNKILYYFVSNTPYCETEYWCVDEFDYSDAARNGFYAYLKERYATADMMNKAIGTNVMYFDEVEIPGVSDTGTPLGVLWYMYRHDNLKRFIDMCAGIVREKGAGAGAAIQLGSTYDTYVVRRCTANFGDLCENVSLVYVDDGPSYDHNFSCDYTTSNLPAGVRLGQEIDGPMQSGASTDAYLRQGTECFRHGCYVVSIANWSIDEKYAGYRETWNTIADRYLFNEGEVLLTAEKPYVEIKLSYILERGSANGAMAKYNRYSDNGKKFIGVVLIDDLDEFIENYMSQDRNEEYSLSSGFSQTQGKGNFSYRKLAGKRATDLDFDTSKGYYFDEASYTIIASKMMHPGSDGEAALVFTCPHEGEVTVTFGADVSDKVNSNGVTVRLLHNDAKVYPESGSKQAVTDMLEDSVTLTVSGGDTLILALGSNGANSYDSTAVNFKVTYNK